MRLHSIACLAACSLASFAVSQEAAEANKDWSAFDPATVIAAAGEAPQPLRFERLWTSQERVRLFQGLAISADGKRVLALAPDGRCRVYDGESGQLLASVAERLRSVTHAALSPDGSRGALGLASTEVVTFGTADGKLLHRHPPRGTPSNPREVRELELAALRFTDDGQHVAWLATDGRLERAEINSGARAGHTFEVPNNGNSRALSALSVDGLAAVCDPDLRKSMLTYMVLPPPDSSDEPKLLERKYVQPPVSFALSKNLLAYQTALGNFVVQSHLHKRLPPGERKTSTSSNVLTLSRTGGGALGISSDEKWVLAVGRGQAEVRRLDLPSLPSLHAADLEHSSQLAVAADVLRIAAVDQDGRLTVLALSAEPALPIWKFQNTVIELVRDKQFELLDKLSDLLQDDPEPFSFDPSSPKHHVFVERMLRIDGWERSEPPKAGLLDEWLQQRPDSKLARLLLVRQLVSAGWSARGSGFANSVTEEGWNVFHQKITQAHVEAKKLLAQDRPPPEAFMWLFDIAKAESWSEEKCMEEADRVTELSPQYLMPHLCMVEKSLMRWGGAPHSSALYASWASDKIDGPAGDALYCQLVARIAAYEEPPLLVDELGIDWERVFKGCAALQDMPQRRPLGVLLELQFADVLGDKQRLQRAARIIDQERTPFVPGVRMTRGYFEKLYRENVDRVLTPEAAEETLVD